MVAHIRLMPNHDPFWRNKVAELKARYDRLLDEDGALSPDRQAELLRLREDMDLALNARFRTTAEYRDFYFARARQLLEDEGIDMPLPDVADDATVEEIDRVLYLVWSAVEVTNSETF